jgi:predicted nucleic acid-binding protein
MIVADANALVKLFITENYSKEVSKIFDDLTSKNEPVLVPDIALPETISGLWKHPFIIKDINKVQFNNALKNLTSTWELLSVVRSKTVVKDAARIAVDYRISIYDALYVSLSLSRNAALLTFDGPVKEKREELGIKLVDI